MCSGTSGDQKIDLLSKDPWIDIFVFSFLISNNEKSAARVHPPLVDEVYIFLFSKGCPLILELIWTV